MPGWMYMTPAQQTDLFFAQIGFGFLEQSYVELEIPERRRHDNYAALC